MTPDQRLIFLKEKLKKQQELLGQKKGLARVQMHIKKTQDEIKQLQETA